MTSRTTPTNSRPQSSKTTGSKTGKDSAKGSGSGSGKDNQTAGTIAEETPAVEEEPIVIIDDSPPVNYVDIKLHSINNLPASWISDSGPAPLFQDHAFRYEVDVNVGGAKHTFNSGRVLQQIQPYEEYVERATLPPPIPAVDPDDEPEYKDPRRVAKSTFKDAPSNVADELPPPPLSTPSTADASASSGDGLTKRDSIVGSATAAASGGGGGGGSKDNTPGQQHLLGSGRTGSQHSSAPPHLSVSGPSTGTAKTGGGAGSTKKGAQNDADAAPPIPFSLYWILAPEHDNDLKEDLAIRAKEAKASNAAKKKGEVPQVVEVKPPPPSVPMFCVARIPLGPKQLAHFESQVEQGLPLTLTFRRVLRSTCPPEWGEDQNESKFQAKIRIPLSELQKPGSLKIQCDGIALEPIQPEVPHDEKAGHGKSGARKQAAAASAKRQKGNAPLLLNEDPFADHDNVHPYSSNKTTVKLTLECFSPITRLPSTRLKPSVDPCDLIPKRVRPPHRVADATKIFADSIEQLMLRIVRDHREHKGAIAQQLGQNNSGGSNNSNNNNNATSAAAAAAAGGGGDVSSSSGGGGSNSVLSQIPQEELRATFLSMLHTSGKIHIYKEVLVPAVEQVVRETFLRQPKPSNSDLERSASELYSYLMDHVHLKLNELFSSSGAKKFQNQNSPSNNNNVSAGVVESSSSSSSSSSAGVVAPVSESQAQRWARLAQEAETMGDNDKATKYWQQRLVCGWSGVADPSSGKTASGAGGEGGETQEATVAAWNDFAEYCLRCRDVIKAEQAYKEAISIDPTCVPALCGYGTLLLTRSRFVEAEVFLQSAVDLSPSIMTWSLLALFFDRLLLSLPNSPEEAARLAACKREATYSLNQSIKFAEQAGAFVPLSSSSSSSNNNNNNEAEVQQLYAENQKLGQSAVFLELSSYLLKLRHEDLVNVCLSRVPVNNNNNSSSSSNHSNTAEIIDLLYAQLFSQTKQYDQAHELAEKIRANAQTNLNTLQQQQQQLEKQIEKQHHHHQQQQQVNANTAAAAAAGGGGGVAEKTPTSTTSHTPAAASEHESSASGASQSSPEEQQQNEQQTAASKKLAQQISSVASVISQTQLLQGDICSQQSNYQDAEKHYELGIKAEQLIISSSSSSSSSSGLATGAHYIHLGNVYIRLGKYKDALTAFSNAVKLWPCGLSWLGVGISYYRMDDLARAELALNEANILNNLCTRTWAFLSLVCFRQKREADGDQAFNQAIKLGLSDAAVMSEIGAEQARLGRHGVAEACFRRALALHEDSNIRMQLAKILLITRKLAEARAEFLMVAKSSTNETQRARAEEQAASVGALIES